MRTWSDHAAGSPIRLLGGTSPAFSNDPAVSSGESHVSGKVSLGTASCADVSPQLGMPHFPPRALTIAGSDSGGGAGIQADLKTFQEFQVYGTSVITALTAQNSLGVQQAEAVSPAMVEAQLDSVLRDIGTDAVKTGMLPSPAIVNLVVASVQRYGLRHLVVDPVLIAKGGYALASEAAFEAIKQALLPHSALVTPNVPEACKLLGVEETEVRTLDERIAAAQALLQLGPRHVLLKGGHAADRDCVDILVGTSLREAPLLLRSPRLPTRHTHGTGCSLSAAVTALLAAGATMEGACREAKAFVTAAIAGAVPLGSGTGSLWHAARRSNVWQAPWADELACRARFPYNKQ